MDYYKLAEDSKSIRLMPRDIVTDDVIVTNPSREKNAEYGRYPYVHAQQPEAEDGKHVVLGGYEIVDTDDGKVISENWKALTVVDPYAEIPDGKILRDETWTIVDDTYVHGGVLKDLVDNPPEELGEHQRLEDLGWEETDTAYTHVYHVVTVIDEPPTDAANEGYHWEDVGEEAVDEDTVRRVYEQVPNPPKPVLTVSKMYFEIEVAKRGLLDQLDALIDGIQVPLDDAGHTIAARRLYDRAVEFSTDNVYFQQFFTAGCQTLGISEEDGWQVLVASQAQ